MDDGTLQTAFEAARLTPDQWHHREHVRMAWIYLQQFPFDVAMDRMREHLRRLVAAFGVVDTPERGYHETLTRCWLQVVDSTIRHHGACESSTAFVDANPHLQRTLLRLYYSPARIRDTPSKYEFVTPDLAPLPT